MILNNQFRTVIVDDESNFEAKFERHVPRPTINRSTTSTEKVILYSPHASTLRLLAYELSPGAYITPIFAKGYQKISTQLNFSFIMVFYSKYLKYIASHCCFFKKHI